MKKITLKRTREDKNTKNKIKVTNQTEDGILKKVKNEFQKKTSRNISHGTFSVTYQTFSINDMHLASA